MGPWSKEAKQRADRLYLKLIGPSDYHYEKQSCICKQCIIDFNVSSGEEASK